MEDENADRVYVPGTTPTPPARDVEPFWPPEESGPPVHGGRPVPHDAPPPLPLPPADPDSGVYRPVDRTVVPPPTPHQTPAARRPATDGDPATSEPPVQAWPNLPPRLPADPPPVRPVPPVSADPDPVSDGGPASPDSPWSQPPHRPAPPDVDVQALGKRGRATPPPTPAAKPDPPIKAERAEYYPTVTPRQNGDGPHGDGPHGGGAVYRPEPRLGDTPPAPPATPGPKTQAGPPPQPGPQTTAGPRPQTGSPPQPGPAARRGPFPPTVDPRAVQPHPHVNQQPPGRPAMSNEGPPPETGPSQPPVDPYQQVPWVSDGTPTAEEFARRRLAKPAEPVATMGARAILQKGTMGLVRLAPGKYEKEYKQDVEMVRRNFGGLRQVTVVNPKGGAGKTVAVLLLAMTFGQKRGGYVLAWDNNETQGTLGMRAQQDFHARTVRDMMRDLHLFRGSHGRVGDLSQYVRAQGEGMFDVLASDESATAGEMLTASAFAEIREIVSRFYKLIFVDTGNNVRAQNWQAAMDATDQLVITMSARNDSAETAARMLDHLEQSGRQRLVRQAVTVVTMPPTRKDIDLPAIQRHFAARTRAVLMAPYEKLIDSGEPIRYGALSSNTRDAWLKIAASVAEGL